VEGGLYGSVAKDTELTYTLTLKNNSAYDHKGILVQLPVPTNAEIVKVDGAAAKNKTVKFTVDIAAGETVAHTVTVKATGEVGSVINTGVGYVHAIPLFEIYTGITTADADAAAVTAAIEKNKGKNGEEFLASYLKEMGMEGAIPSLEDIQGGLFNKKNLGAVRLLMHKEESEVAEEYKNLYKMQIPYFFGGQTIATECESLRIKAVEARQLQAGDILIWQATSGSDAKVAIHNGTDLVLADQGQLIPMAQWQLDEFIVYRFFIALRPVQAR
jgi:hypothetical protein